LPGTLRICCSVVTQKPGIMSDRHNKIAVSPLFQQRFCQRQRADIRVMKILIVGHACAPGLGSEPGFTWNWAWHLSRTNQVWVIAHPEYKDRVDRFLAAQPNQRLNFIWATPKSRFDYWTPGRDQERGIRLHYWLWMKEAYRQATRLYNEVHFDIVHHVSWSTIAVPPPFWKLPALAVWGPVGGGQSFPLPFVSHLRYHRIKEALRSLNLILLPFSPKLHRSLAAADLVLATNYETKELLERAGGKRIKLFLDCGIDRRLTAPSPRTPGNQITLLWAGRLEPQKGLAIALRALAECTYREIRFLVAGSGTEQTEMKSLTRSLGLNDRVEFLGRVPHETMTALFQSCDAFVFTSLRDSFGSVVLEALSNGLPVIALNHQGMRAFVPEDASIKVSVESPEQVINDLARAFEAFAATPERRPAMSRAALAFAEEQTWTRRAEMMNKLYAEVMNGATGHATEVVPGVPTHRSA
jgi:glycosyltransferase involved in cell wall biosynthesis